MTTPQSRTIAPLFWLLFGAGGMLAALFGTGMIIVTGFLWSTAPPDYDSLIALLRNPIGKLAALAIIALFFWHGAERLYLTLKDMRAGPLLILKLASYGSAALATLFTAYLLLSIGF